MLTGKLHLFHVQHLLAFDSQPGFALLTIKVIITHIDAKADASFIGPANRHRQRVIGIHYAHFRLLVDAQFRRPVLLQTKRIPVHMIFSDVEHRCRRRLQT
ncbi:hypothetical protein NGUA18_04198 [Salmonella enterica]|nr:hypothetical protein NGUA18_04198 [Salmonella enterica]